MRALALAVVFAASGCGLAPQCSTRALDVSEVCADGGVLAANTALTVQVRESCGSACGKNTMFACNGVLSGSVITLAPTISECVDPMTACPAVCRISAVDCAIPALAAGTYTLSGTGFTSQQLVISASATASACRF
ncbi:MAG: hypothetical protein QM817_28415 [Archangium sp.]